MARFALIEPNTHLVAQITVQQFEIAPPLIWLDVSDRPETDEELQRMLYVNGEFVHEPDPPEPQLAALSRRQFFQILAVKGMITYDQALAAVQHGQVPPQFDHLLSTFTPEEQFAARMILAGSNEFQRDHLLVEKFAADQGISKDQIDAIWREGAAL